MIRIRIKKRFTDKLKKRLKSKAIIRKRIKGSAERPRLVVFRSHKHMYAQIIDDNTHNVLLSASTLKTTKKETGCDMASVIGKEVAKQALKKGIKAVVFDRNGFLYHGRVKAVAEGAREAGLKF